MLRLRGEQVELLWDEVLPVAVRQLPDDRAALQHEDEEDQRPAAVSFC